MRRTRRLRDYPPSPRVDPAICPHPFPVALLKFNELDETILRCDTSGKIMTLTGLAETKPRLLAGFLAAGSMLHIGR